jgi:hypothetical protein
MSTYTPNNNNVYLAAFSGAVGGLLGQCNSLNTSSRIAGANTPTINVAGAWAQEVDTLWALTTDPDQFEYSEINDFSEQLFQVYEPQPDTGATGAGSSTNPATYALTAQALLNVLADGETYLAGKGITPGLIAGNNEMDVLDATIAAPGAGPASYIFVAAIATVKETGVFDVSWAYPWNGDTTADSVTLAIIAEGWSAANWAPIVATGKIVLTAATAIGNVSSGAGPAINAGSAPGLYTATGGGTTITATVTGASPTSTTVTTAAFPTITGLLTTNGMQWQSGQATVRLAGGNAGGAAGFALGSPVVFKFLVSATHTITMTGGACFKVTERTSK